MLSRASGEIARACGGRLVNCSAYINVGKFVNNDKKSELNCCYVAISGEKYKGIYFAENAINRGASLVITDTLPNTPLPCVLVADVREALIRIAAYYRKKERKRVIAITGSVGKTTTKELCACVLAQKEPVLKTQGNKNNTLGLPLTLLSDNAAETAVLEAGISEKGEMSILSAVSTPDIAIITGIGQMHAQTLGSREEIAGEKLKILENASQNCILILPANEPLLHGYVNNAITVSDQSADADYFADNITFTAQGSRFDVVKRGEPFISDAFVSIVGGHGVLDALFACALGDIFGIDAESIKRGLIQYKATENRQNIIVKNGVTVIDDCYNFGPESARAALSALSVVAGGDGSKRTVLMLGSMLELGEESESIHIALGKEISNGGFDALITVGELARNIALGAMIGGMKSVYDFSELERDKAARCLKEQITSGTTVLIKGSRKMKMEEFVRVLTE